MPDLARIAYEVLELAKKLGIDEARLNEIAWCPGSGEFGPCSKQLGHDGPHYLYKP
jgi:hypothetical protein